MFPATEAEIFTTHPFFPMLPATLLIIAQAILSPLGAEPSPEQYRPSALSHHRGHAGPSPTPRVKITIVNATCVPAISLSTSGTNHPVAYPRFPQGEWTANEPIQTTEIHYLARTLEGAPLAEKSIRFGPISAQVLLLTGDLSRSGPADKLPQVADNPVQISVKWPPNFQFHLYPVEFVCKDPCHYRVVNAMPSKTLVLKTLPEKNRPSRQLGLLAPGNSLLLTGQPPCIEWIAEIDGKAHPLSIMQEGAAANCLIPFFLRDGKPTFVRVFETP
jgi:hypothetical protein